MAEEIVFKTTVDTGNSVKAVNDIDKALKQVNDTVKNNSVDSNKAFDDLNKKVESGELSVRQLTRAVKEYATIAVQAGEDSPVGQEAIKRAGQLKDRLGDLQTQINANANDGRNMQTALQLGQGIASGYAVAQGAMALFGSESKDLQKTLVKLQAIQALLVGLEEIRAILEKESLVRLKATQIWNKIKIASEYAYTTAIGTSTGALKLARIAMLALPIVAIIAGLVAIAGAMGAFGDSAEEAREKQAKLNEENKKDLEQINKIVEQSEKIRANKQGGINMIQKEIDILKAKGATDQEVFKKEQELHDAKINNLKIKGLSLDQNNKFERTEAWKTLFQIKQAEHEKLVSQIENDKKLAEAQKESSDEAKKKRDQANKERIQQERQRLLNLKSLENEFLKELEQAETEYYDSLLSKRQKDIQDINAYYFNLIAKAEQAGEDTKVLRQAQAQKLYLINKEYTDKEADDLKKALDIRAQLEEEFYASYQETINTSQQNEENAINEKYNYLIETAKQYGLDTIELERQRQEQIDKINETANLKKIDDLKKITDATMSSLNALNDLQNQLDANKLQNIKNVQGEENDLLEAKKQSDLARAGITAEEKQKIENNYLKAKYNNDVKAHNANNEIQKRAFNRDKALKIASVGINTAEAISKSVAISPATFGAPFSVFAGLTGIAQIATIASTKFDGGGASVSAPTIPSGGGGGEQTSTGFGAGSTSQVSSVGLTDTSTGVKVTVVDSEIKAVMDASNQANVLSTFGG